MVVFPNAKINIGLNIVEKRPDNYHNIESVFYPIPLKDILEVVEANDGTTEMIIEGLKIDGPIESNLVMKAYNLLKSEYNLPPVKIYMNKLIPFGAGLGGGSSDAAFMLKALNDLFSLGLSTEKLKNIAKKLGADCPFFIENKPAYVTGIGDIIEPISFSMQGLYFVLVKPNIFVSTQNAYSLVVPKPSQCKLTTMINYPIQQWKGNIKNDFEISVFELFPEIAKIKDIFYENDAIYASMSGSGSSVFGLFKHPIDLSDKFNGMYVFQEVLGSVN